MKTTWLTLLVLCSVLHDALTCGPSKSKPKPKPKPSGSDIAAQAEKQFIKGSTKWSFTSCHWPGCNKNKCNSFVADMIKAAGITAPQRYSWFWSPIGANEWANPRSTYLTRDSHWTLVTSPKRGDIVAFGGHVGIVRYSGASISAAKTKVVSSKFGFRAVESPTFWRYSP